MFRMTVAVNFAKKHRTNMLLWRKYGIRPPLPGAAIASFRRYSDNACAAPYERSPY